LSAGTRWAIAHSGETGLLELACCTDTLALDPERHVYAIAQYAGVRITYL